MSDRPIPASEMSSSHPDAARALHVTQPALSRRIQLLEAGVNFQLQGSSEAAEHPLLVSREGERTLVLLLTAFYVVLLDIRYIRMQFKIGERELFRETVDNEQFRRALREAKAAQESAPPPPATEQDPE